MRSSSSSPIKGDFSTQASVRSSCGKSAARPAAIRSITAICCVTLSRSAPATGTPRSFKARIIASKNVPRLRTRIITSPGRTRRISPVLASLTRACGDAVRSAIFAAMRSASFTAGSSARGASTGRRHSIGSSCAGAASGAQISTRPGRSFFQLSCTGGCGSTPEDSPLWRSTGANTASTAPRIARVERKDRLSRTAEKSCPACVARCSKRRLMS